jgi:hypothetical protein
MFHAVQQEHAACNLSPQQEIMILGFRVIWLFCNSKNIILPRSTKIFSNQSVFQHHFTRLVPGNFYRVRPYLVCIDFGVVFGNAIISSNFKMPVPHGPCSVLPTAPLCSRDGDGCHFERTAGR